MRKLLPLLAGILLLGSCINEQENIHIIHARDLEQIEAFLNGMDIQYVRMEQEEESGIVIIWTEEAEIDLKPRQGDSLWVDYTGKFLDGRVFDTSHENIAREHDIYLHNRTYEPLRIKFFDPNPQKRLIQGFEYALTQMNEGDKTVVLVPSSFAYGRMGSGNIPPNTPLRFDLDLLKVGVDEQEENE